MRKFDTPIYFEEPMKKKITNTIKIKWHKKYGISIRVDVQDDQVLKAMIARLVMDFYPRAKVYHHGKAVRFKV